MSDNFKKPIFVGKVGKIPKSINANEKIIPKPPSLENEIKIENNDKHIEEIKEIPKITNPKENITEKVDKVLNYQEPSWSGLPITNGPQFELEVLKSGVIIENIVLMPKKYWIIGRLPNCDIYLAHPTISRHHAILQFNSVVSEDRSIGFYIYDLGSTHGTFLNKARIKSRMYVKVHVGHMLKFGNSTRTFILKGPEEDAEPESELTVTELKINRINELKKREAELLELKEKEEEAKKKELEQGIDWGMGEDADEETDLTENPYAATNNEELYLDDPKKTLRGFFEREGEELQYNVEEKGLGQFICTVELPIENSLGRPIIAEAIVKGKKKEAVVQCALEACRILDRAGVLRQAKHESRKRKPRNWEEDDYCNSDDDEFFDRTGAVERKKQYRMKIHNANVKENVETYDSLVTKEKTLSEEIENLEKELSNAKIKLSASEEKDANLSNVDSLDEFMNNLTDDIPDKQVVNRLTLQLTKLKQEHAKTLKLVEIAKPTEIPSFQTKTTNTIHDSTNAIKKLPLYGKRLKVKSLKETYKSNTEEVIENDDIKEEEEMDETVREHNVNSENNKLSIETDKIEEDIIKKEKSDETEEKETPRIIGPSKPDPEILTTIESVETKPSSSSKSSKKKNKRNKLIDKAYEEDDKYTTWMPPENQKGDGKTDLNEKFGY